MFSKWQIYLLIFFASSAQVVKTNTRQAAIPDVIGKRLYSRAVWQDIKDGIQFIHSNPPLRFVIMMMFLRGLTMIGIFPLFIDFVERDLNAGAFAFGLLSAAASLGYALASILTVQLERTFTPFQMLAWGTALAGLLLVPFWTLRFFSALVLLRFLSALMYGFGNLVANVQIAHLAPSELRGRVSSASWALVKSSQVVSSIGLGFLATGLGTPVVIALAGLCLFVGSGTMSLSADRSVRNIFTSATAD